MGNRGTKGVKPHKSAGGAATGTSAPGRQETDALVALFGAGRHADAANVARGLTQRFPGHGFGWKVLGAALQQLGCSADALVPMRNALALSPADAQAHNNLGNALRVLGSLAAAKASCRRALFLQPDYAEAHNNLGTVHHQLRRWAMAEQCYRQALRIDPNFTEAQHNLGTLLLGLGRLSEAENSCLRTLRIDPHHAGARNTLGTVLRTQRRFDLAESCYRQALCGHPDFAEAHANLGVLLKALGRPIKAEQSCRRALRLEPRNPAMHYELGTILIQLGKPDAAAAQFRSGLGYDPEDSLGARHMLASLGREPVPLRASMAHLRKLYEQKSHTWDQENGAYHGHELVAQALRKLRPNSRLDILDAGCGTGLAGAMVGDLAKRLDGIDLSPAMLDQARAKGIYTRIDEGDLMAFMHGQPQAYDAIICAATLIHFGDLAPVFDAAALALRDGGLLIFTLFPHDEGHDTGDVAVASNNALAAAGCYAHGQAYVRRLSSRAGFDVAALDLEVHEYHDEATPVMGMVVALLRRPRSPR